VERLTFRDQRKIKMLLKLKVKNPTWRRNQKWGYYNPEFDFFIGKIIRNKPYWVKNDCLCLTTKDNRFSFRVIKKINVVNIYKLKEN
jgi:hypothetical protein